MPRFLPRSGRHRDEQSAEPFSGLPPIAITPIGWVRNDVTDPDRHDWSRVRSVVVLDGNLADAVSGLEGFSHVIVVCWLDRVTEEERRLPQVHPAGDPSLPSRGVLALRTHHRPNPVAVSVVRLQGVEGTRLTVLGLDAADRTPVLDVKPYVPLYDSVPAARLPAWAGG